MNKKEFANKIDGAYLKPNDSLGTLHEYISKSVNVGLRGVCVLPHRLVHARDLLEIESEKQEKNKPMLILCVNFPWGTNAYNLETIVSGIKFGAEEIDYLVNIGFVKDNNFSNISTIMQHLVAATHDRGKKFKFIIEPSLFNVDKLKRLIEIGENYKVDWFKTSSGIINSRPTTIEDINTIRKFTKILIKASGGIETEKDAVKMLNAGASILGIGSGVNNILG